MEERNALQAHFRQVTPYVPGLQPAQTKNLIKLNTNENPYPPSPKVKEALSSDDEALLRLYPSPEAATLRRALAEYLQLTEEEIFTGNGSDEVLALSFLAFFADKKEILFPDVTYSFYKVWAELFGIPYRTVALTDDFLIRPEDYGGAKGGIVLPNPNAPTGVLMSLEQIEEILKSNPDVVVIVDEAYIDFGGRSAVPLIKTYDNLLVTQTFSKSRALAGIRVGYAAGSAELIAQLKNVKYAFNSYTMNRLSIAAAHAALTDNDYFCKTTERIVATRQRLSNALNALGFTGPGSSANFLFVRHPAVSGKVLYEALKDASIYVRHFDTERTADYLRITIGTDDETDALIRFLTDYLQERNLC